MSVQVKCRILRETDLALKLSQMQGEKEVVCWVLRSKCEHASKGPQQADGSRDATITMEGWLARVNQLETED